MIRMMQSRRTWAGHVKRTAEKRRALDFAGKSHEERDHRESLDMW
jgi:hypothetical protein